MKTKKYVKKPVVIEAYQTDEEVIIHTLEGDMKASPGDYIITGVHGEKYPCKPDIFEETYDEVKGMTEKEKLLDCIDNYMDGDGNWYDPYFAIQETFSKDKIEKMTEEEIINLVTLAENIQNELY